MIDDPLDALAQQRAELDQALMGMLEAAHSIFVIFNGYVQEGFTREEALQLVIAFVKPSS